MIGFVAVSVDCLQYAPDRMFNHPLLDDEINLLAALPRHLVPEERFPRAKLLIKHAGTGTPNLALSEGHDAHVSDRATDERLGRVVEKKESDAKVREFTRAKEPLGFENLICDYYYSVQAAIIL